MHSRWASLGIASCILSFFLFAAIRPALADDNVTIRQGWSTKQKVFWYTKSQGSRLIPLSWLRALEQPGSDKPFLDAANFEKFRYLPNPSAAAGRLPVGFAIDDQDDSELSYTKLRWKNPQSSREAWVGMNCAACHTAEITYNGKRMRIDGGPTLADFQGFMESLNKSLVETKSDSAKGARFAANVLKAANTPANRSMLDAALSKFIEWQMKVEKANLTPLRYGFGRLDAFGNIFNKVALVAAKGEQTFHPSNAPVSYPFLWNVPQHDKVQWNGIVSNTRIGKNYDIGALGRNTGEVIGVFADVKLREWNEFKFGEGFVSSAQVSNLSALENQLGSLRPPLWPTGVLGRLDQKKRDWGRDIFRDANRKFNGKPVLVNGKPVASCASCHLPLGRNDLIDKINARMTPLREIGTDIWMACNAVTHKAKTGLLENTRFDYIRVTDPFGLRRFEDKAPLAQMLRTTVIATIWAKREKVIGDIAKKFSFPSLGGLGSTEDAPSALPADERPVRTQAKQDIRNKCLNGADPLLAYKARPLTGIWATAPYLHNGSVPTLYDLLLPPKDRPPAFPVGTREFDPVRGGYVTRGPDGKIAQPSGDNSFLYRTRDDANRVIDGNSNAGHDYGNEWFTEDERWALVEYMKGL